MDSLHCNNCGTELPENAKFCLNCGKVIENEEEKKKKELLEISSILAKYSIGKFITGLIVLTFLTAFIITFFTLMMLNSEVNIDALKVLVAVFPVAFPAYSLLFWSGTKRELRQKGYGKEQIKSIMKSKNTCIAKKRAGREIVKKGYPPVRRSWAYLAMTLLTAGAAVTVAMNGSIITDKLLETAKAVPVTNLNLGRTLDGVWVKVSGEGFYIDSDGDYVKDSGGTKEVFLENYFVFKPDGKFYFAQKDVLSDYTENAIMEAGKSGWGYGSYKVSGNTVTLTDLREKVVTDIENGLTYGENPNYKKSATMTIDGNNYLYFEGGEYHPQ